MKGILFKQLVIILSLFYVCMGIAQEEQICFEAISANVEEYYNSQENYAFDVEYAFYSEENQAHPIEKMQGEVQKNKKAYYSKMGPTELIYFPDAFLKINHEEEAVFFSNKVTAQQNTPVAISSLQGYFKETQVTKNKNRYICTLLFKKMPALPYSKMILEVDAKTYQIYKQELYMIPGKAYPGIKSRNQKTVAGKMVTTFSKQQHIAPKLFKKSNYFIGNKEIKLSGNIKAYTLYN